MAERHEPLVDFLVRQADKRPEQQPAESSADVDENTWALLADGLLDEAERAKLIAAVAADNRLRRRATRILADASRERSSRRVIGGIFSPWRIGALAAGLALIAFAWLAAPFLHGTLSLFLRGAVGHLITLALLAAPFFALFSAAHLPA